MLTEKDIKEFYKEVEKMGLKFPVAAISKATGYGKSNVSQYLSGKLPPSESFIEAFYKSFPKSTQIVSHETNDYIVKEASTSQLLETINLLVRQNDKLADTNKILAEKISSIPVGVHSGRDEDWDSFRLAGMDFLFEIAAGKKYSSVEDARKTFGKKLSDEARVKRRNSTV